jgi:hypothetical protein
LIGVEVDTQNWQVSGFGHSVILANWV